MVRIIVVGGGIFGITAALTLAQRGFGVTLVDPGPIPHPLAESTDISKIVRLDYGGDELYTVMMDRALDRFRSWNREWERPLFHETGLLFMSRAPMTRGAFEYDSFDLLTRRGHRLERLDGQEATRRFPMWSTGLYLDGYYNPSGGFAESGHIVSRLSLEARDAGVTFASGVPIAALIERGTRICGVKTRSGDELLADIVVVAAGSWTPHLVPWLAPHIRSVGHPVFHLVPSDPSHYMGSQFPVFGADISNTGWYGFPAHEGVVKIANHGVGRAMHPESVERQVTSAEENTAREFLVSTFPTLAAAPIEKTRICVYGDTWDQHFWIAPDPDHAGLVVAAGGSGHAFKFAPLLGDIIADAVEGKVEPRFRWRTEAVGTSGEERSRRKG